MKTGSTNKTAEVREISTQPLSRKKIRFIKNKKSPN
jgi:hypothetical protein